MIQHGKIKDVIENIKQLEKQFGKDWYKKLKIRFHELENENKK